MNYFKVEEFACKCSNRHCPGKPTNMTLNVTLVQILNRLREELQAPIIVTSAIRCHEHNKAVGGAVHSLHLQGLAVDVSCTNVKLLLQLAQKEEGIKGIGDGSKLKRPFLHLDVRPNKNRVLWSY